MFAWYHVLLDWVGSAPLPLECPDDSELGAWFLSPQQHFFELLIGNGAFLYLAHLTWRLYSSSSSSEPALSKRKKPSATSQAQERLRSQSSPSLASTLWTHVLIFLLALSWAILFIHKYREDRLWFLLQPCHVLHLLLIFILTLPPTSPQAVFLFNVYLHLLFSPFLGLVAADLSCYDQPLELINWALQHALLLLVPLVLLTPPARFPLVTGAPLFLLCFSIEVLYHSFILTPIALVTSMNLNYCLCPPQGILSSLGGWYRVAMTGFSALLSLLVRYGLVESWRWLVERGLGGQRGPDVVNVQLQDRAQGQGKKLVMNEETQQPQGSDGDGEREDDEKEPGPATRKRRSRKA